jgi:hypothetical protein
MSSQYVKDQIINFFSSDVTSEANVLDVTAQFDYLNDYLESNGVTSKDRWLGLQFVGSDEQPITVPATNTSGKYREFGSVFVHVVEVASSNAVVQLMTRAENIRNKFRGLNLNGVRIESVTPPNFEFGATLNFDGGYTACAIVINYEYDINL